MKRLVWGGLSVSKAHIPKVLKKSLSQVEYRFIIIFFGGGGLVTG